MATFRLFSGRLPIFLHALLFVNLMLAYIILALLYHFDGTFIKTIQKKSFCSLIVRFAHTFHFTSNKNFNLALILSLVFIFFLIMADMVIFVLEIN